MITSKMIDQNIFSQLNLDNLPEVTKKELFNSFINSIMQAIALRVSKTLNPQDQQQLITLLQKGTEEDLGQFLKSKSDNLDEIAVEESIKFKSTLSQRMKSLSGSMASSMA